MTAAVGEASPYIRAQANLCTLGLHEMASMLPDYMRMVAELSLIHISRRGSCSPRSSGF